MLKNIKQSDKNNYTMFKHELEIRTISHEVILRVILCEYYILQKIHQIREHIIKNVNTK